MQTIKQKMVVHNSQGQASLFSEHLLRQVSGQDNGNYCHESLPTLQ